MNPPPTLLALPAFADNYLWLLHDGLDAVVVDPGDAAPVERLLDDLGLRLAGILVTHHHPDHIGGLAALRPRLAATKGLVYAPAGEAIPGPVHTLKDGDRVELLGLGFEVMDVPGHTAGHIAYMQRDGAGAGQAPWLFCGDTLFSAGCGRLFEGTPAQMHRSLSRLASLPDDTRVCCTHEYTLSNLRFARAVEPDNAAVLEREARCTALRAQTLPTVPSTLAEELDTNPFLRCDEPAVRSAGQRIAAGAGASAVASFAALRAWKNRF